jgi:hypothetical protein
MCSGLCALYRFFAYIPDHQQPNTAPLENRSH